MASTDIFREDCVMTAVGIRGSLILILSNSHSHRGQILWFVVMFHFAGDLFDPVLRRFPPEATAETTLAVDSV